MSGWVGSSTTSFYKSASCSGAAWYVSTVTHADVLADGCFCFRTSSGIGVKQCYVCGESAGVYTQQICSGSQDCSSCSGAIHHLRTVTRIADNVCVSYHPTDSAQVGAWKFRIVSTSSGTWPGLCPAARPVAGQLWQGSASIASYTSSGCTPQQSPQSTVTMTRQEVRGDGCSCVKWSTGGRELQCLTCGASASHVIKQASCNTDCSSCSDTRSYTDQSIPLQTEACSTESARSGSGALLATRSRRISSVVTTSTDPMMLCVAQSPPPPSPSPPPPPPSPSPDRKSVV